MNHCFVGIRKYLAESTLHRHEYHQIVLPRVGNLELEVEGQGGRVEHGVGAFIIAGARHALWGDPSRLAARRSIHPAGN